MLITGPTGAGKTSTLYAALNEVSTPEKNVVTLEDPVEVTLPGITQVNIQTKAGMTFAAGLRAVLRQDPDVVLVGEIRDLETAEHALAAAMTGHLVLSTLHTTSAVAAVSRLVDMGTPAFLLAPSLSLVVAQRLVRKPCQSCAEPTIPSEDVRLALGISLEEVTAGAPVMGTRLRPVRPLRLPRPYRHLRGPVRDPRAARRPPRRRRRAAGGRGGHGLRASAACGQSGMLKAFRGETTYEEVLRVTAGEGVAEQDSRCTGCGGGVDRRHGLLPLVRDGRPLRSLHGLREADRGELAGVPVVPHAATGGAGTAGRRSPLGRPLPGRGRCRSNSGTQPAEQLPQHGQLLARRSG